MVLWDLMLGPGEAPVLNDLPLWELAEVLLERRRVEFGGNDDDHPRGRRRCGCRSSRWRRWWRLKTLPLLRSLQRFGGSGSSLSVQHDAKAHPKRN